MGSFVFNVKKFLSFEISTRVNLDSENINAKYSLYNCISHRKKMTQFSKNRKDIDKISLQNKLYFNFKYIVIGILLAALVLATIGLIVIMDFEISKDLYILIAAEISVSLLYIFLSTVKTIVIKTKSGAKHYIPICSLMSYNKENIENAQQIINFIK